MSHFSDSLIALPNICAPREELLQTFDRCTRKQFVYVQAPAGYGKTISALLWLKKAGMPFTWFFLDRYDNTLSLFYRSLCRSLLNLAQASWENEPEGHAQQQLFEEISQTLSSPSFSDSPVEGALEFISLLPWRDRRCSLVLDDLHNIANEEVLKSLPYALKRLPASINVLVLSRTEMPEAMQWLTQNDKTGFIGIEDLTFTPEEIRSHFISYGWFISREKAKGIHADTDGWVIILNAMLATGGENLSSEDAKLSLEEYFERNVWAGLDEDARAFLTKTSIVDSFALDLCQTLTESDNCEDILHMLMDGNVNLYRIGQEYRYHNLFLQFLRDKLQKSGIDQAKLFLMAARHYLDTNQFFKAAFCSMRTDEPQLKMHVIQSFFQSKNPALEHFLELASVYDAKVIPQEAFNRNPILYMPNILASFLHGETGDTIGFFDRFYELLPTLLKSNHPIVGSIAIRILMDFRVGLTGLLAFMDEKGIRWGDEFPGQAAVVTVQMPMLHRSVRDFHELLKPGVRESVCGLFSCFLPGDYECFCHSITAGLLMEQDRVNEAFETALAAYGGMTENASATIRFGVSAGLAEICFLKAETSRGRDILARLREWIDANDALYLLKNLAAYEARQKLLDGDKASAEGWLENYYVSGHEFGEFYKLYQNFTTVRAYIALGRMPEALSALEQIKKLCAVMARPLDMAEADVLAAIAEWAQGKKKAACDRLFVAIEAMQPYGFVRVMANEGKAILPILAAALKKAEKNAWKGADADDGKGDGTDGGNDPDTGKAESLCRFVKEVQVAAYAQSKRYAGVTGSRAPTNIKLSPKQALILGLLAKGHRNAEIVKLTGLSINTIREHTRVAYKKLDVTNALDAITKARELGLLD